MEKKGSKIKDWWKNLVDWKKGGIIGFIFGSFVIIVNLFFGRILVDSFFIRKITGIIMMPSTFLLAQLFKNCVDNFVCLFVIILIHPFVILFYTLIGLVIGFIANFVKSKIK